MALFEGVFSGVEFAPFKPYISMIIVLILTYILVRLVKGAMKGFWEGLAKRMHLDQTHFAIISKLISAGIWAAGIAIGASFIPGIKGVALSLFAGAGVLALMLGLATQKAFSNIISGIFIVIFKPVNIGDRVLFDNQYGIVEDITLDHTVINTWENKRYVIPNSQVTEKSLVNYSMRGQQILTYADFSVHYESDLKLAKKIIEDTILQHPDYLQFNEDNDYLRAGEKVAVRLYKWGANRLFFRAYFWTKDFPTSYKAKCDVTEQGYKNLVNAGVKIPYPFINVVMRPELAKQMSQVTSRK